MYEAVALALLKRLYQRGLITAEDIDMIADEVAADAEGDPEMVAHWVRCTWVESEIGAHEVERRRSSIRAIDGGKQGDG